MSSVPIWLLGSSDFSARLAAQLGLPFAFAHHFAGAGGATGAVLDLYRDTFRPSAVLDRPWAMIGVTALAADDAATAHREAAAGALSMLLLRTGRLQQTPTPEQAAAYPYTEAERDLIQAFQSTEVIGDGAEVAAGLAELVDRFGVDELMITTRTHGAAARRRSFELIADAFDLAAPALVRA